MSIDGYAYFFIDEAPYLSGFLNESAEWADKFVPCNRIKIVISGTDSFELWLAMGRALYHRYVRFSTNRKQFPRGVQTVMNVSSLRFSFALHLRTSFISFTTTTVFISRVGRL